MASRAPRTGARAAATLDTFQQALRLAADRLEAERPLVDEKRLRTAAAPLTQALADFCESLTTSQKISQEEYLAVRSPWLEAWARDPDLMKRRLRRASPGSASRCENTKERLQLMVEIIARSGPKRALRMTQLPRPRLQKSEDYGIPIDREANQALLRWGTMPREDFLRQWSTLDSALLDRAAQAIGLRIGKWTTTLRTELHHRAVRFVRNTMV